MDSKTSSSNGNVAEAENSNNPVVNSNPITKAMASNGTDVGDGTAKNTYFRADKIDFKSWDIQLEKHLSRVWSKEKERVNPVKEEWEIDLAKLDLKCVVAHGAYGTVFKGVYDGQDVAGNERPYVSMPILPGLISCASVDILV